VEGQDTFGQAGLLLRMQHRSHGSEEGEADPWPAETLAGRIRSGSSSKGETGCSKRANWRQILLPWTTLAGVSRALADLEGQFLQHLDLLKRDVRYEEWSHAHGFFEAGDK